MRTSGWEIVRNILEHVQTEICEKRKNVASDSWTVTIKQKPVFFKKKSVVKSLNLLLERV